MTLWNKCQEAASWLDKKKPNWYNDVDIEDINMGSCERCIHGQVFGIESLPFALDIGIKAAFYYARVAHLRPESRKSEPLDIILEEYWVSLIKMRRN